MCRLDFFISIIQPVDCLTNGLRMEISSRLILILVLLGLTHVLSAQTYKVIRFGLKDSLSVGSVNDISQDSTGFIWVASDHGLHRYNGNYFVTVHRDSITFLRFQQSGLTAAGRTVFNFKTKYPFDEISFESLPIKSGRPFRNGSLLVNDSFGVVADELLQVVYYVQL